MCQPVNGIEPAEAHVVVRYDPECPNETFLSHRTVDGRLVLVVTFGDRVPESILAFRLRSVVAPKSDGEARRAQKEAYQTALTAGKPPAEARAAGVRARREVEERTLVVGAQREADDES